MRSTTKTSLLLLASVGSALAQRKSLSHGPQLPHARFVTEVPRVASFVPLTAPRDVAKLHLGEILKREDGYIPVEGVDYFIREDSYEDDHTGVAHFYVRQIINGLEVADADISLNIKDGHVLSYGDSFYRGDVPSGMPFNEEPAHDLHAEFCARPARHTTDEEGWLVPAGQTVMGGTSETVAESGHPNCNTASFVSNARSRIAQEPTIHDPKVAALHFMIAAHPSPQIAHHLEADFDGHLGQMYSTPLHHFRGHQTASPVEEIHHLPGTLNPVPVKLVYVQSPRGSKTKLTLAWKMEVEMEDNWYEAYMDASHPSHIHSVMDWASDAAIAPIPQEPKAPATPSYRVWKWGINDPTEGKRSVESFHDTLASPIGWHSIPAGNDPLASTSSDPSILVNHTTTFGNNVFAHENWEGANAWVDNYRPEADGDMVFDYAYGPKRSGDSNVPPKDYVNATITQLFYTSNMYHDLVYRYGFDEKSGNFQQHNFGRGGREGDGVIANAQDGSGYNNANFMTPPDGQNGRCRMYIWNTATPYRDGDLEAGIVIHELSHGLSTRLTGGPANSGCLAWGESGGMGEGWGDYIATSARSNKVYSDYPMGAWAANQVKGIRNYPYSTNMTINPSTYKTLDKPGYWGVHAIGEVWAEILWIVQQKLIAKHGYSDTLFPPQAEEDGTVPEGDFYRARVANKPLVPIHGNTLLLQLVISGMKLQPCRPSFFDARDAIIQADEILTGGENRCELWAGFSERGLGPDATIIGSTPWGGGVRSDDFSLPQSCNY
ncbi:hypothetical protein DL93DRAFT_2226339 [Clavulina sp. PMI_390]|nr:hypothetical protein DL93DRAFT_2226339 [Clavulina sp. PMI_390]